MPGSARKELDRLATNALTSGQRCDLRLLQAEALVQAHQSLSTNNAVGTNHGSDVVGFDFNRTNVKDETLKDLSGLTGLTDLSFEKTGISDKGIAFLGKHLLQMLWTSVFQVPFYQQVKCRASEVLLERMSRARLPVLMASKLS